MKKAKKVKSYEPTIGDVLDAVQTGFANHEKILSRHEDILTRHGQILTTLHLGQQNLTEQVQDIKQTLIKAQHRTEDVADTVELNHEPRITRLEQVRK